jgi:hypothetical protein
MVPGVYTALIVVQDGGGELTYFLSTSRASSIRAQLSHSPGGFAWDYVKGDEYSSLKVEWTAFDRYILDARGMPFSNFESLIFDHSSKSSISYTFVGTIDSSLQSQTYSVSDLNNICAQEFKNTSSNGIAVVHLVFLTGSFIDPSAVGISFAADRFAIFGDTLSNSFLREAVAHEMGHLIGLVAPLGLNSSYTPANASSHYDSADPPHCTSDPCLMNPFVSSYAIPCSFCSMDLQEIKNSTAPYYVRSHAPEFRSGLIAIGTILTVVFATTASILYKSRNNS